MADKKISQLSSATAPLAGTEVIPIVQASETKKVTVSGLFTAYTFTTSATGPLVIGGTGATSTLTLRSTSGVGTTGADIIFQTGNNGATEAMRILANGNVGINTSTPNSKLDVKGAGDSTGVTLTLSNGGEITALNDPLGVIDFYSNDASTGASGVKGRIACRNEFNGGWDGTLTRHDTYLAFSTSNDSVLGERVRITNTGNVGIGTTTPGSTLDVAGTFNVTGNAILGDATSDTVRINGYVGIGVAPNAGVNLYVVGTPAGASTTSWGILNNLVGSATATVGLRAFDSAPQTAASAYTVTSVTGYYASDAVLGAGSTITNQVGVDIVDQTKGTNNYGLISRVSSGANKWNIYASGTADNYFSGSVRIYGSGGLGYGTGSGGAVTQTTSRTEGVTLDKTNGAITLVSAAGTTTWQTFTVTNNKVAATDTIIVNQKSGTDLYEIHVTTVAAGSFKLTYRTTGGTTTEQPVFNFSVIKAATS